MSWVVFHLLLSPNLSNNLVPHSLVSGALWRIKFSFFLGKRSRVGNSSGSEGWQQPQDTGGGELCPAEHFQPWQSWQKVWSGRDGGLHLSTTETASWNNAQGPVGVGAKGPFHLCAACRRLTSSKFGYERKCDLNLSSLAGETWKRIFQSHNSQARSLVVWYKYGTWAFKPKC